MKTTELNSLTNSELVEKLAGLKAELFNLRFTHKAGSLENASQLSLKKRDIARVKTIIRQRELGLAQAPEENKKSKKTAKVDAEVKG